MSVDIKMSVCWYIEFNNTGIDWTILQHEIKNILEKEVLHCISSEKYQRLANKHYEENDKNVSFYFKFNTKEKQINAVCVEEEGEQGVSNHT